MDIRSASITADILNYISDGKHHTLQDIADEVEISKKTAQRHIVALSYRYPIETFHGGDTKGGVILDTKYLVQGRVITNEKLQILGKALELLQNSNDKSVDAKALAELIRDFAPPTRNKEYKDEDSNKLYS